MLLVRTWVMTFELTNIALSGTAMLLGTMASSPT